MLLLVLGDHTKYFDLNGRCILDTLPFPVVIFADRVSAEALAPAGPNAEIRRIPCSDDEQFRQAALRLAGERPRCSRWPASTKRCWSRRPSCVSCSACLAWRRPRCAASATSC